MSIHHRLQTSSSQPPYDVASGAIQLGYREISGVISSSDVYVGISALAMVFTEAAEAMERYGAVVHLLGDVGADGLVRIPIAGISGDRFGNMSERDDLLGAKTTIWVTSLVGSDDALGAVLASSEGTMVQMMATSVYVSSGYDRPMYLLEGLAMNMAARQDDLKHSPENDTMSRLPLLGDLAGLLANTRISRNWYSSPLNN